MPWHFWGVFAEGSRWGTRSFSLQLVHQWTISGQSVGNENGCKYITPQKVITLEAHVFFIKPPRDATLPRGHLLHPPPLLQSTVVPREQGLLSSIGDIQDNFCQPVLHALTLTCSCHADSALRTLGRCPRVTVQPLSSNPSSAKLKYLPSPPMMT